MLHGTLPASAGRAAGACLCSLFFDASWGVFFPSRAARPYLWHLRHRTRALLAELSRARPRPFLPRRPVKDVEAPRSEVPSTAGDSRPPSNHPCGLRISTRSFFDLRLVTFACRFSSPFRPRLPVARPFRCACSARRRLGPVRVPPRSVRKRRLLASLDRRRRPTTSATRHDPRAHPSSCSSSPVLYKETAAPSVATPRSRVVAATARESPTHDPPVFCPPCGGHGRSSRDPR